MVTVRVTLIDDRTWGQKETPVVYADDMITFLNELEAKIVQDCCNIRDILDDVQSCREEIRALVCKEQKTL